MTSKADWSSASYYCQSLDAHLLVIDNAQEQSAVAQMMGSISRQCSFSAFLSSLVYCKAGNLV